MPGVSTEIFSLSSKVVKRDVSASRTATLPMPQR